MRVFRQGKKRKNVKKFLGMIVKSAGDFLLASTTDKVIHQLDLLQVVSQFVREKVQVTGAGFDKQPNPRSSDRRNHIRQLENSPYRQ
jgi:hypothetical protein